MEMFIYIIIATLILLYIIDKKELIPPDKKEEGEESIKAKKEEKKERKKMPLEQKNEERRKEIYKNVYATLKEINPLKTYRVWTYIEIPNQSRNIHLSYRKMDIPVYFKKCIELMEMNVPELIVLTPLNIKDYLPNFDIEMKHTSEIPLKIRIDILFACILEEYGGLCISPGTIVYDVNKALSMLKNYEIVTYGGNPKIFNCHNNMMYPNSYVIGSQKKTPFIKEYKRFLLLLIKDTYLYNFKVADDSDVLSHLIKELEPTQFHFGTEYDGTYNSKLQTIHLSEYMGSYDIDFQNKERLSLISFPYDKLYKSTEYKWFLDLSEEQFMNSNLELKHLILKDI